MGACERAQTMSQFSKVNHSRNQWKGKAKLRGDANRYLRKQITRIKAERDQAKQALKKPKSAYASLRARFRPWLCGPRSMSFGSPCDSS